MFRLLTALVLITTGFTVTATPAVAADSSSSTISPNSRSWV